ncbi:MAG TPA: hypothetical protein DCG85_05645 [Lachnospiraceae bacterium]|nr:hypothetical protein [Lachnospiraceae bacterium]
MKNILLIHNSYRIRGGEDVSFANDVAFLKSKGNNVYIYKRDNAEIDKMGLVAKLLLPFNAVFSIRSFRDVYRLIKENKIDRVYVHNTWLMISPSVFYACFLCHVPVTLRVHNYRLLCPAGTLYRPECGVCEECIDHGFSCALKHKCYRGSFSETLIMVVNLSLYKKLGTFKRVKLSMLNDFMKEKILCRSDVRPSNVSVRGNDCSMVIKENKDKLDRPLFDKPYFLYVGRLTKEKGLMVLLEAYKKLMADAGKSHSDPTPENGKASIPYLVIVGEGALEEEGRKYVEKHGMERVKFLGSVPQWESLNYTKYAKALIVPSLWYEGYPMVINEAHLLGTPVIGSKLGSIESLLLYDKGDKAFIPGNVSELYDLLRQLLKNDRA